MALTGVNKALLRHTYNYEIKAEQELKQNINKLRSDVITMNQSVWHGGTSATQWYKNVSTIHDGYIKYINRVDALNIRIKKQLEQLERL